MKHRILHVLISSLLLLALVAGCSSSPTESTAAPTTESAAASSVKTTTAAPETSATPDGPSVLRVFAQEPQYATMDYNTNKTILLVEELLNIDLQWEVVANDVLDTRITLAISGGEMPDIFYFIPGANRQPADLLKYGQQGIFLALDDVIPTKMPNLHRVLTEEFPGGMTNITEGDGHIYSVPNVSTLSHIKHYLKSWTNVAFCDALDMPIPTTLDEYYEYLKGVKEQDVNGNGDPNDEVGLVGYFEQNTWYTFLMNSFVYTPLQASSTKNAFPLQTYVNNSTGKIEYSNNQDGYREGLRYVKKLWDEGLIYEGSTTQTSDQLSVLYMSEDPVIGAIAYFAPFVLDTTMSAAVYKDLVGQPPLTGPDGKPGVSPTYTGEVKPGGGMITSACQDVDAAARFLDFGYSDEGVEVLVYGKGVEGVEEYIVYAEEGAKNLIGTQASIKSVDWDYLQNNNMVFADQQIRYLPDRWYHYMAWDDSTDLSTIDGVNAVLMNATVLLDDYMTPDYSNLPEGMRHTPEDTEELAVLLPQIETFIAVAEVEFITGERSLDTDWDAYKAQLVELGADRVIEIIQGTYDR